MKKLSTRQNRRTIAGFVRNGVFVLLGLACAVVVVLAATTAPQPTGNAPVGQQRPPPKFDPVPSVAEAAWNRVNLTAAQKAQLAARREEFKDDQLHFIRAIAPTAELLRSEWQRAARTPGQEALARQLRIEILTLTAPLQQRQIAFDQQARSLLQPHQLRQLQIVADQVKTEKHRRKVGAASAPRPSVPQSTGGVQ
jgi:hypothetical protein